ncbi:MAG: Fic/DOC family N-terminal domain-containing protein [Patescibacteria group bacterium]
MYSKDLPYNDLPPLPLSFQYEDVDVLKAVNTTNIALSELKGASLSLPNQKILLAPLTLREAVASNSVENIHTTISDVLQAEVLSQTEIRLPEKETLFYREALLKGLQFLSDNKKITQENIIVIQSILEREKTGIRKKEVGKITRIKGNLTKEIIYTPPDDVEIIKNLLKNFEEHYNNDRIEIDATVQSAILHYQFEAIHPFADGNGRTGRILMVLYFILRKRLEIPLLFISRYILNNRSEYYKLLAGVTENGNWKEWILFILKGVEEQANSTKDTIIAVKNLITEYKHIATEKELPTDANFIDHLFSNAFYTYNRLAQGLSVHRNTATSYLKQLQEAGVLESMTVKRELVFYYPKFLDILSK